MKHLHVKEVDGKDLEFLKKDFTCIRCGNCCKMKLVVNDYDIQKIEEKGYEDFYEKDVLGRTVLKMIDNKCIFLKENEHSYYCEVYEYRPNSCEKYPFFNNLVMECPSIFM